MASWTTAVVTWDATASVARQVPRGLKCKYPMPSASVNIKKRSMGLGVLMATETIAGSTLSLMTNESITQMHNTNMRQVHQNDSK